MGVNIYNRCYFVFLINVYINTAFTLAWFVATPSWATTDAELLLKSISIDYEQSFASKQCDYCNWREKKTYQKPVHTYNTNWTDPKRKKSRVFISKVYMNLLPDRNGSIG